MLTLYFDGMAKPNPGRGAYGWFLERDGREVATGSGVLVDQRTNNEAEYVGLIQGLQAVQRHASDGEALIVKGDSRTVINQSTCHWNIRQEHLVMMVEQVWRAMAQLGSIEMTWIPRAQNKRADALGREAFDKKRALHKKTEGVA